MNTVEFTAQERQALELPMRGNIVGPEAVALRKIIDCLPFVTTVAAHGFKHKVTSSLLNLASAELLVKLAIEESQSK